MSAGETRMEPVVAQKAPYPMAVEAGKTYFWCACGLSQAQPFCDGSHKGTGMAPMRFTAESDKTVYLCGCKATKNAPFCDGGHSRL
jgi:CDGSH-type Zn-finger protein